MTTKHDNTPTVHVPMPISICLKGLAPSTSVCNPHMRLQHLRTRGTAIDVGIGIGMSLHVERNDFSIFCAQGDLCMYQSMY